jgi:hypothetical protein
VLRCAALAWLFPKIPAADFIESHNPPLLGLTLQLAYHLFELVVVVFVRDHDQSTGYCFYDEAGLIHVDIRPTLFVFPLLVVLSIACQSVRPPNRTEQASSKPVREPQTHSDDDFHGVKTTADSAKFSWVNKRCRLWGPMAVTIRVTVRPDQSYNLETPI